MAIRAVDCFIVKNSKILLIKKKTGFGAGKFIGPGGKIEEGETPEQASIRELSEEIRIIPKGPKIIGELKCYAGQKENINWHVYILTSEAFDGTEIETEVATPVWFPTDKIPLNEMWEDVKYWIPLMLENKKFAGQFYFDKDFKTLLEHKINVLD